MDRFDPFVKYADVYGDIINWEKDPMNKPQNQNKYFFSDGKTYYEQICKMLRLMSVFKEAFNQIYSNEDEISEAWENFVNNLSASVVEGSEPDVTLTWTDDSVNFEFTMVPGVPGEQGVGITSISFNSDYTMTITLSDGNTYTSMSLKGETGPQGPQGETGSGLQILDVYATLADLQSAHPTGEPGDAYQVGSAGNYTLYIWSSSQSAWVQAGTLGTVSPYTSAPLMDGTASAGSQNLYARGDHVHPSDTSRASKEEMDALIKTSQSLIDQSFTYRESPAIQDGLARIDKIKGNTLVFNQLVNNGNFADTSGWASATPSQLSIVGASNNRLLFTCNNTEAAIMNTSVSFLSNHKLLFKLTTDLSNVLKVRIYNKTWTTLLPPTNLIKGNGYQYLVINPLSDIGGVLYIIPSVYDEVQHYISNVQVFDLTMMGIDTIEQFNSLFPLSYYSYQSTLLPFKGTGIKTVGKNKLNYDVWKTAETRNGISVWENNGVTITATSNDAYTLYGASTFPVNARIPVRDGKTITLSWESDDNVSGDVYIFPNGGSGDFVFINNLTGKSLSYTPVSEVEYVTIRFGVTSSGNTIHFKNIMIRYDGTDSAYEPYKESTLSLPISTYFPNGMASAKNVNNNTIVYDELSPKKAIKRLEQYTFTGNETISGITSLGTYYRCYIALPIPSKGTYATKWEKNVPNVYNYTDDNSHYYVQNSQFWYFTTASTAEAIMAELTGTKFYYDLATPVKTAVDLDLSFKSYLDGTEQLLPVNGSVPSTSPIIADMTYLSIDDAMEYIIDKLANVPQNTQQILESLEDDVADLQEDVGALQPAVSALQTSVGNINTNIGQLSSTVAGHTASISDVQSDISDLNTSLSDLEDTVTDHTSRIGTLESGLSATNGNVQNLETSVSDLDDTVTAQGTTVTALDSIIQDISNNPVVSALGSHELGFVAAYVEATLAANTGTKVTIPKPVIFPNNYTPLFIVGMSTGSSDVSICEIPPTFGSRESVSCRVWNHGSQKTAQITVYILCMRQRQSQ